MSSMAGVTQLTRLIDNVYKAVFESGKQAVGKNQPFKKTATGSDAELITETSALASTDTAAAVVYDDATHARYGESIYG